MADHGTWKRLGDQLRARRVDGLGYASLARFCRDRAIEWRTAWNLETGAKDSYAGTTLLAADAAYGFQPGCCAAFLDGGDLIPVPDAGLLDDLSPDAQVAVLAFIKLMRARQAAKERQEDQG